MPCRDTTPYEDAQDLAAALQAATQAACDLITCIRNNPSRNSSKILRELSKETLDWIKEHDKKDALRLEEEELEIRKAEILKKLTREEQELLGFLFK